MPKLSVLDHLYGAAYVRLLCRRCHAGVQQDDSSRLAQLRCHTAKDGHIYRKFTWGNRKSLVEIPASKNIDVRSELVQYYK